MLENFSVDFAFALWRHLVVSWEHPSMLACLKYIYIRYLNVMKLIFPHLLTTIDQKSVALDLAELLFSRAILQQVLPVQYITEVRLYASVEGSSVCVRNIAVQFVQLNAMVTFHFQTGATA